MLAPHMRTTYRPDIDGLRAISVAAVVGFHALPDVATGGFIGVDVFFVISGFLISGIIIDGLDRKHFSFIEFYGRRIRRIFPALSLVLCASAALGWVILLDDEYRQLGRHILAATLFLLNFQLRIEVNYFDTAAALKPLLHLWSLSIEEQFYLLWPVLMYISYRFRGGLLALFLGVVASSFAYAALRVSVSPITVFYSPLGRFWELALGSTLAFVCLKSAALCAWLEIKSGPRLNRGDIASVIGLLFVFAAIVFLDNKEPYPGAWALLPTLGSALLIAAGPGALVNRCLLASPVLVQIGLISYPLYLWHWPLLSFARIHWSGMVPGWITAATVLLSFALAWLTWRFIERPLRAGSLTAVAPVLVALAVCVGGCGLTIYWRDGFPARVETARISQRHLADLDQEKAVVERSGVCHINNSRETVSDLRQKVQACMPVVPGARNILVLGDSHAGDLWIALSQAYGRFNFIQATGAGCNPAERNSSELARHCRVLFDFVNNEFLRDNKVDVIAIAARWRADFRALLSVVRAYQARGIPVVLFGPTFEYYADLPKIIARKRDDGALTPYLDARLNRERFELDREMARFAAQNGIVYVSIIDELCSAGHCPALGPSHELYVRDYGHWTLEGAKAFGAIFAKRGVLDP